MERLSEKVLLQELQHPVLQSKLELSEENLCLSNDIL